MNADEENQSELEICRKQLSQMKLENEVLLHELFDVNEKLHQSEQLKGHFISNVSNELVNPFSSILALSQNIKLLADAEMEAARQMASLIYDEAFHLDFQLRNVFAAALIEAGTEVVSFSAIDITEMIGKLERYFASLLQKKQIKLAVDFGEDEALKINSDKEKLDLILRNLISNSIKYSPDNSIIEIAFRKSGNGWQVEIGDQGKGIHPVDRKIIFDRFRQIDEKINSINTGQGLGLSIVKAYTEMLGGEIELSDATEAGTRICLNFSEITSVGEWDNLDDFIIDSEASY